jgi:enamine deaminase RidA (YjgF/YER057c/UK114 family)
MNNKLINAPDAPQPLASYSQAVEVSGYKRLLFVSGQIAISQEGQIPADFPSQCRLAWRNVIAQLRAADMSIENLVKVTTFLADRQYGFVNREIRQEFLGDYRPAATVVVAGLFDAGWLIEVEAIAAA